MHMNEILRKNDVIRFMTRDPQVHLIEIFGHCEFNPEEIGREEYVGRIKSVIGDGESFLMSTLSPMPGFLCIADASDVLGRVDLSELSEEELSQYKDRVERMEAPNVYENEPSASDSGKSVAQLCEEATRNAVKALFPDQEVACVRKDGEYGMMCRAWYIDAMDHFLQDVKGKARRRLEEKRNRLAEGFARARFKEYYSVTIVIERPADERDMEFLHAFDDVADWPEEGETQMIQEFWLAAVDHNFEEVSIMRGIDERSDFFRSLGPEYDDMDKAFSAFRQECCVRG